MSKKLTSFIGFFRRTILKALIFVSTLELGLYFSALPMDKLIVYLYCDKRRDIQWSPRDFQRAQAIYHGFFPIWVTIKTFSITTPAFIFLGNQYWKSWFSALLRQLGNTGKYCSVDWAILEFNFNIIMFIYWEWSLLAQLRTLLWQH